MHIGNYLGVIITWSRKMEVGGVWESLVHALISGFMKISEKENHVFQSSNSNNGRSGLHEWIIMTLTDLFTRSRLLCQNVDHAIAALSATASVSPTVSTAATLKARLSKRPLDL